MKRLSLLLLFTFVAVAAFGQPSQTDVTPGRFDQGKMWTFENPPTEYFKEAYDFSPTDEWMEDVRMSALRFASWCSASFISESGLIMTNHHCSRSVVASVMNEGENFDQDGFYAATFADERQVPELFVDQLVVVVDITNEVSQKGDMPSTKAIEEITNAYKEKDEWKDLIIESRTFYSGGKYSLYGFKRYSDIRLVLYPELALGYFGGDPDNFTYPRYNLDFTFFRAYDEDGQPLKPSNFFSFNPAGATENEAVFVIGNPGSTGRYLTMAQLQYDRDVAVPALLSLFENRINILLAAAENIDDVYEKDSVTNLAFSLSNSQKAYSGRLKGLYDPYLMTKKEKKENEVRASVGTLENDPWEGLKENTTIASQFYADYLFLSPNPLKGNVLSILHKLYDYRLALEEENEEAATAQRTDIETLVSSMDASLENDLFAAALSELAEHSNQAYIQTVLGGSAPQAKATEWLKESIVLNDPDKFFKLKPKKLDKEVLMEVANTFVPKFREAVGRISSLTRQNKGYEGVIMNEQFKISGVSSPPDATFSLRIADGLVKGYEYNGTKAPVYTTYYGLYDRHFSHNQTYPWDLPEKWKNPPTELLQAPLNFVCTADIIGGNSGSPVINKNAEVVGLVFDGNIESLPGYFIFDDQYNRTVSVHAAGIVAAVKYIYKAERLLPELNAE